MLGHSTATLRREQKLARFFYFLIPTRNSLDLLDFAVCLLFILYILIVLFIWGVHFFVYNLKNFYFIKYFNYINYRINITILIRCIRPALRKSSVCLCNIADTFYYIRLQATFSLLWRTPCAAARRRLLLLLRRLLL